MNENNEPRYAALFTDLYELAMLAAYHAEALSGSAVFELHFRALPARRNYVVAAGLDEVLDYLEHLRFTADEVRWLSQLGGFNASFLDSLASFRFCGDVYALPEGAAVFPHEPIVQVVAPLPQAQLAETFILNQVHVQSLAATKAARLARAAGERTVTDFGTRRAHGADAALKVVRGAYIGGIASTSNVLAARRYGVPCVGTMAHSYIQAHEDEARAFDAFSRVHPATTLLVDTYDTLEGVRQVIELARRRGPAFDVSAIRLDSGALEDLIPRARRLLDEAGLGDVRILASGGLNERRLQGLAAAGAPVDGFSVGTELAVSGDSPTIDLSYKLVEYEGRPRMKLSTGKVSLPGRKQVFRRVRDGAFQGDVIGASQERLPGEPQLVKVMESGRRTAAGSTNLDAARRHCARELDALPPRLHELAQLDSAHAYPVTTSEALDRARRRLQRSLAGKCRES